MSNTSQESTPPPAFYMKPITKIKMCDENCITNMEHKTNQSPSCCMSCVTSGEITDFYYCPHHDHSICVDCYDHEISKIEKDNQEEQNKYNKNRDNDEWRYTDDSGKKKHRQSHKHSKIKLKNSKTQNLRKHKRKKRTVSDDENDGNHRKKRRKEKKVV
eukprot:162064_1